MTTTEHVTDKTAEEQFLDIDGWGEIAIKQRFGKSVEELREEPFPFIRALIFAHRREQNDSDTDAYTYAMGLSVRAIDAYFAEESAEETLAAELGVEPASAPGKDDELPEIAQL